MFSDEMEHGDPTRWVRAARMSGHEHTKAQLCRHSMGSSALSEEHGADASRLTRNASCWGRESSLQALRTTRLMPLRGAGGLEGVLVAARQPCLVLLCNGYVRLHPWKLDRGEGVRSSARFHSPQCQVFSVFSVFAFLRLWVV